MKSVQEIKRCIIMQLPEFRKLIEELTDGFKTVEYEFGAFITNAEKADESCRWADADMVSVLSNHFNERVLSWHSVEDDVASTEEDVQIWIVLENNSFEDIYEKRKMEYLTDDAKAHWENLMEEEENPMELSEADYKAMAAMFDNGHDCNVADNDQWNDIVKSYYKEMRKLEL